jgi:hypothetical protein
VYKSRKKAIYVIRYIINFKWICVKCNMVCPLVKWTVRRTILY